MIYETEKGDYMGKNMLEIRFLGAINTVTGSCTYMKYSDADGKTLHYLVDAGIMQQEKEPDGQKEAILQLAKQLDGVFITHSHIDHIGLLPDLLENGFAGNIYCTKATASLMEIMLKDYYTIPDRRDETEKLLYDLTDKLFLVDTIKNKGRDFQFGKTYVSLHNNFTVGFLRTSHILGSTAYYFQWRPDSEEDAYKSVHFSGDVGTADTKEHSTFIAKNWQYPYFQGIKNYFILESTYGGRERDPIYTFEKRLLALERVVRDAMNNNKTLIIPVFSQHRAQEVMLDLFYLSEIKKVKGPTYTANFYKTKKAYSIAKAIESSKEESHKQAITDSVKKLWEKHYPREEFNLEVQFKNLSDEFIRACVDEQNRIMGTEETKSFTVSTMPGMLNEISKVYAEMLGDVFMQEGGTLKFKYLSNTFRDAFVGKHPTTREEVESIRYVLKKIFTGFCRQIESPKKKYGKNQLVEQEFMLPLSPSKTNIILSSSGMCDYGYMPFLIEKFYADEDTVLALTGYQAEGTNGSLLKKLADDSLSEDEKVLIKLNNPEIWLSDIKLSVIDLSPYYSGHADMHMLREYVCSKHGKVPNTILSEVFLNHGQDSSRIKLQQEIESLSQDMKVTLPELDMVYNLTDDTVSIAPKVVPQRIDRGTGERANSLLGKTGIVQLSNNAYVVLFPEDVSSQEIDEVLAPVARFFEKP